jgi:hypothetical protein
MRFYVYEIHTDNKRNRLRDVSANRVEAVAIEQELQSRSRSADNHFFRMFPAQNVDEARMKADTMRPGRKAHI